MTSFIYLSYLINIEGIFLVKYFYFKFLNSNGNPTTFLLLFFCHIRFQFKGSKYHLVNFENIKRLMLLQSKDIPLDTLNTKIHLIFYISHTLQEI